MANKEVVICSPVRTAIGTYGGTLKDLPAVDLGAVAIRATLERSKLSPGDVGTIVMGNVIQAGNRMNSSSASGDQWWHPGWCSGAHGQPGLWLGCAGDCECCSGGDAGVH